MITQFRPRTVPGLASIRNSRTRIYAPGSDPKFAANASTRTFRLVPAFPPTATARPETQKLWDPAMLDQLKSPLTRYRE